MTLTGVAGIATHAEWGPDSGSEAKRHRAAGLTVWLTGLPSAGKTTLALALGDRLRSRGEQVEVLDGDDVRTHLSAGLGFSRADRDTHVDRVGFVAELLARHGVVVLVPVIAPYEAARELVRAHHRAKGTGIVLVHLSTPLDVCADRDVKGLYAKAFRGEISAMTGVDDPYEVPADPDLRLDTSAVDLSESVRALLDLVDRSRFPIAPAPRKSNGTEEFSGAPPGRPTTRNEEVR